MILYLWDAPPRCGVSGSLEKAQEAAGTTLIAGHAPSARVESARLAFSAALEPGYARTGQVWQAHTKDGVVTWEPGDTRLAARPGPRFAGRPQVYVGHGTRNNARRKGLGRAE